ncbi:hypothetical protein JST97_04350 [bacterium]|nr:hypothetical protein [bacterium]
MLITLLVNFTISLPLSFKGVAPYVKVRLIGQPTEPAGHKLHEEVDFLENQHSRYPKRMIILSNHSALLHQLTDSQFLEFDSFTEMFRLEEWQRLANTIEAETSPWIIVGFDFVEDDLDKSWRQLVNSALQKHYHRIKASSNQRLQIYAPNHAPQTNQGG